MFNWLILCLCFVLGASEKVRYDDYALYSVQPATEEHLALIRVLHKNAGELDFWSIPSSVGYNVSVVSPPERRENFENQLARYNVKYDVISENIQR